MAYCCGAWPIFEMRFDFFDIDTLSVVKPCGTVYNS